MRLIRQFLRQVFSPRGSVPHRGQWMMGMGSSLLRWQENTRSLSGQLPSEGPGLPAPGSPPSPAGPTARKGRLKSRS